jgi:hypothetical protein
MFTKKTTPRRNTCSEAVQITLEPMFNAIVRFLARGPGMTQLGPGVSREFR